MGADFKLLAVDASIAYEGAYSMALVLEAPINCV
jgi:hypothetical protein